MKTPKKNASSTSNTASGAKKSNIKPLDNKSRRSFDDDEEDEDGFEADLDDLGGFDDLGTLDDDDDY